MIMSRVSHSYWEGHCLKREYFSRDGYLQALIEHHRMWV